MRTMWFNTLIEQKESSPGEAGTGPASRDSRYRRAATASGSAKPAVFLYISLPSQLHLPLKAQTRRRAGLSNLEGWCQNTRERARGF